MKIQVIKNKKQSDFESWSIWTCEPSTFDWEYDQEEHCYIIDGYVTVISKNNAITIRSGDYVIFPKGLRCIWKVHSSIKKHYIFK